MYHFVILVYLAAMCYLMPDPHKVFERADLYHPYCVWYLLLHRQKHNRLEKVYLVLHHKQIKTCYGNILYLSMCTMIFITHS